MSTNVYDDLALEVEIKKSNQSTNVTVTITKDQVKLITIVKSHGKLFHATDSSHLTSNDFFKEMEVPVQEKNMQFEDEKKKRLQLERNEAVEKKVFALKKQTNQLNAIELEKLLIWHDVQKRRWEIEKKS